jgi:hypothetical protein
VRDLLDEADRLYAASVRLLEDATRLHGEKRRATTKKLSPVSLQRACSNRKIAPQRFERSKRGLLRNVPIGPYCTTTHVSIAATCPETCPFKGSGCYAETGRYGAEVRRLDEAAKALSGLDVITTEADTIDRLWLRGVPRDGAEGGRDLRLHVAGDVCCAEGARVLGAAAERWLERGGGAVWTYTHRWREIPVTAWGPIHALASTEILVELDEARTLGYVPAHTVPFFETEGAYSLGSHIIVPCPAETRKATCVECRMCLGQGLRRDNVAVGFALHGMGRADAAEALDKKT